MDVLLGEMGLPALIWPALKVQGLDVRPARYRGNPDLWGQVPGGEPVRELGT